MLKARDDIAKTTPGGAAATARENTAHPAARPRRPGRGQPRLALTGASTSPAIESLRPTYAIGAGKGALPRHAGGLGTHISIVYVADFGAVAEGDRLARRDGRRLSRLRRPVRRHVRRRRRSTGKLKIGPYRLEKVTPRAEVGTLNSAIDGLDRAGDALQQFDSLEASVSKVGDRIELRDGHTTGSSIGLTTAGRHRPREGRGAVCAASSCRALRSTICCRTCRCSARS